MFRKTKEVPKPESPLLEVSPKVPLIKNNREDGCRCGSDFDRGYRCWCKHLQNNGQTALLRSRAVLFNQNPVLKEGETTVGFNQRALAILQPDHLSDWRNAAGYL